MQFTTNQKNSSEIKKQVQALKKRSYILLKNNNLL